MPLSWQNLEEITTSMRMVAEGVKTAASVDALSTKMGVEMPICQQVFEASFCTLTVDSVCCRHGGERCCELSNHSCLIHRAKVSKGRHGTIKSMTLLIA